MGSSAKKNGAGDRVGGGPRSPPSRGGGGRGGGTPGIQISLTWARGMAGDLRRGAVAGDRLYLVGRLFERNARRFRPTNQYNHSGDGDVGGLSARSNRKAVQQLVFVRGGSMDGNIGADRRDESSRTTGHVSKSHPVDIHSPTSKSHPSKLPRISKNVSTTSIIEWRIVDDE